MSVKAMGFVWDADLPRDKKFILLAYADHADHEGGNIYPSIALIHRKTGYSERQVQRITKQLVDDGILVYTGESQYSTNMYKIDFSRLPARRDVTQRKERKQSNRGDTMTPPGDIATPPGDIATPPGDIATPPGDILTEGGDILTSGGDIYDKKGAEMSPEPSLNHPLTVIKPLKSEPEILKTPLNGKTVGQAFQAAIDLLRDGMPKASFNTWVAPAQLVDYDVGAGIFRVAAPNEYTRDWLESRVRSTLIRHLTGICNRSVDVEFILEDT